jgi:asparagine synthase (glutamine-hydrolysing)
MCGIAGIVGIESRERSDPILRAMLGSIVHRGPDEEGMVVASRAAVGTRRLSIIDLPGGSQPVWNEDGTLAAAYNGEIYNFRALRSELETLGHRFRTLSDTEVIVHAYEAWGDDCVRRLQGMFAFAVVEFPGGREGQAARVFLARDRLGIKPLYYAIAKGVFCFASEVKALIASELIEPCLSPEAIASYLLFGAVGEPSCIVQGVVSLAPGHSLSIDPNDPTKTSEPKAYWSAKNARELGSAENGTAQERVRSLLEGAVKSHLVADVPVGVFLSSGIDSTAIAALASRAQEGIHTFTVAFPEAEFNEADIARRTARTLGTQHREISISGQEMAARLEEAIAAFDQPTADGVNTYFVSWAARQAGLKVALSGLGSDELFGGYRSFQTTRHFARVANAARILPEALRSFTADRVANSKIPRMPADALRKTSAACGDPDGFPHPYFFARSLFTPQAVASALQGGSLQRETSQWSQWIGAAVQESRAMDPFTAVSWLELRSYLLNMLLRDTDAMSMRHSLEVRVPFLDTALVEYVLALPEAAKHEPKRPKSLLIDAVRDLLPAEVITQRKRTFTLPWKVWLRGKLGERVGESLGEWSPALEAQVKQDFVQAVWSDFLKGRTTWSRPWSLFVLNEWTKRNVSAASPAGSERRSAASISAA